MQKSSLFSVALLLGLGLVSSAEADHQKVKIGGDISLLTKYIGGTSGSSFCDDPVAQMGVYLRHKNGFWGGFGLSQSPFSTNDDGGDEEDLLIGYNGRKGAIYYDLGYSYYNLQSLSETSGDLHNLSVGLSSDVNGVAPYVINQPLNYPKHT